MLALASSAALAFNAPQLPVVSVTNAVRQPVMSAADGMYAAALVLSSLLLC
jgi:hypothetical protein